MPHFIYILYSEIRDRYYIGSCANLNVRLSRHNAGAVLSTKNGRPWKMLYSENHPIKSEALKRENYIKRMKSRIYIEELIRQQGTSNFIPEMPFES